MSINYKELVAAKMLTGTAAACYTAPNKTAATIQAATAYNPTAAAVQVNLYRVATAGAAGSSTLIATKTVPAGCSAILHDALNHKLEAGSSLWADGNGCALNVSGVEYIPE